MPGAFKKIICNSQPTSLKCKASAFLKMRTHLSNANLGTTELLFLQQQLVLVPGKNHKSDSCNF